MHCFILCLHLDHKMASNRKRTMFHFFAKSKKNADNGGGKRQETSSSTSSLTDCPSDNTAKDNSVQNPNESETSAGSDQPSTSGKKKTEKRSYKKIWLREYNNILSSSESK